MKIKWFLFLNVVFSMMILSLLAHEVTHLFQMGDIEVNGFVCLIKGI